MLSKLMSLKIWKNPNSIKMIVSEGSQLPVAEPKGAPCSEVGGYTKEIAHF